VVLAELFTGADCGPCAGADIAMDAAMKRYPKSNLAVLMYHEHIPEPDPLTNPSSVRRLAFYEVNHTPTLIVDGETLAGGGGDRSEAKTIYERFATKIDSELPKLPELSLTLTARREGNRILVRASVEPAANNPENVRLQIVLAEKEIRYSGNNGIRFHPMVVRASAGMDDDGLAVEPSGPKLYEAVFDISTIDAGLTEYLDNFEAANDRFGPMHFTEKKDSIDAGGVAIVAFVQDMDSKRVLQTAYAEPDAP
jgi:hypothetical protein